MARPPLFRSNQPGPATHALVIGVNEYPNLGGGINGAASVLKNLGQLTAPVPSAMKFAKWLMGSYQNSRAPLASVRCLLSGGLYETTEIDRPTSVLIQKNFELWEEDCSSQKDNVAIFYFCGHGFVESSTYILPEDCCTFKGSPWKECIDFSATYHAMKRCQATTQLYILDACRSLSKEAHDSLSPKGNALFDEKWEAFKYLRDAPIFMSATYGSPAYASSNQPTDFTNALVECLERFGASSSHGRRPWWVTTDSLRDALGELLERRKQFADDLINFSTDGESNTPRAQRLHSIEAPEVLASVFIDPEVKAGVSRLWFSGKTGAKYDDIGYPDFIKTVLSADHYELTTQCPGHDACIQEEFVFPPVCPINIQIV